MYDPFRKKIAIYTNKEITNAPEPDAVLDTVLKIVNEKSLGFSYPISKGTSLILMLQGFAYNALESTILKNVNKTKIENIGRINQRLKHDSLQNW